ncbi:FAD-binding protein [Terrarubrum flagellatum]|uniref:FAD-binding protein n=1 Tax=Terrirubrum flagellatum TaxID=2895980 RepID=UPI003144F58E
MAAPVPQRRNWAGNVSYGWTSWHEPETLNEARRIVARESRIRALGARHSFGDIANTDGALLSTARLDRVVNLDRGAKTVTVEGGARYGELAAFLHGEGFALPNLASLPHISVAGAIATATHGSGDQNRCLAAAVSALDLIGPDGDIISLERGDADFSGAVIGLGCTGIVARLQLDLVPTFEIAQNVYEDAPLEYVIENFDSMMSAGYSVSLFTDWTSERVNQIWVKALVGDARRGAPGDMLGEAKPATRDLHPISSISAAHCTPQCGVAGPWHERLPHFRFGFAPSSGDELQSEYLVPRIHAAEALRAVNAMRGDIAPLLQISEIRSVAADDLWMSPFYKQPCIGLHFTWKPDWSRVSSLLPDIEAQLAPFGVRPHWGKLASIDPSDVRALFPRFDDFARLAGALDPGGKFRNDFTRRLLAD